jgi:tetratricopeptide (TPR) repeat protein
MQENRTAALILCSVSVLWLTGCASHRLGQPASDLRRPPPESLGSYISRVRALSAAAKSRPSIAAQTLESWDPRLSAALTELAIGPTAERHRRVAIEYRRLGVLDKAYAHLSSGLRLDPGDAAAFDLRARIWRDWGFAHLGLADAFHALALAPASPVAANTLGTLLEATGQLAEARRWYQRAVERDPQASYALNNMCYVAIMARDAGAVAACRRALVVEPGSHVAGNNLALAFAAEGDLDQAREQFENSSDPAAAHYNMGIVFLARHQYGKAVQSFDAALKANPGFARAARRVIEARAVAVNLEAP